MPGRRGRGRRRYSHNTNPGRYPPVQFSPVLSPQSPSAPYYNRRRSAPYQRPDPQQQNNHHRHQFNRRPRPENTAASQDYHDNLHPAMIATIGNIKASSTRLQLELERLNASVEELTPSGDPMIWSFSPGMVVYVPSQYQPPNLAPSAPTTYQPQDGNTSSTTSSGTVTGVPAEPLIQHPELYGASNAYYPSLQSAVPFGDSNQQQTTVPSAAVNSSFNYGYRDVVDADYGLDTA